jgi:excisionase family DNA binding protein
MEGWNMATLLRDFPDAVTPTPDDARLAEVSSRLLTKMRGRAKKGTVRLRVESNDEHEETVAIPLAAFCLLTDILTEMAKGNAITLIPIHAELTTQQAADLINVSRPFLIEQLEKGEIPFRKVGKHRRILFADLMKYKHAMDRNRLKALEKLSAIDQELGLGY